ncbi:TPA: RepB family plasmid replication initiator protein [Escherichia coli]
MELSHENAWGRLNAATSNLFKRSVELIYPTGAVSKRIFNWTEYAEFNRDNQTATLIFSKYIPPLLFHLKNSLNIIWNISKPLKTNIQCECMNGS